MSEKKRRKRYSEETMQLAIKEIKKGASTRSVALKYKIPRSTLQNRSSGKTQYQERPGPRTLKLNEENEKALVDWIVQCSEDGKQVEKSQIANYAKGTFNCDIKFSYGWYRGFFRRNPQIQKFVKHGDFKLHYGLELESDNESKKEMDEEESSVESIEYKDEDDVLTTENNSNSEVENNKRVLINEPVQVALCFACGRLITESDPNLGIRCNACIRTYHISCAKQQLWEMDPSTKENVFSCLICWGKLIEKR